MAEKELKDIEDVLEALDESADQEKVSVGDVLEVIGPRAYGPILLAVGLIAVSPVGGIPGIPSIAASIVFLISVQILFSPKSLWLPKVIVKRSIGGKKLKKSVAVMRKPARFIDKLIRPRFTILTKGPATAVIGLTCMILAISVPVIELMPFAGLLPASAFAAFGLALTAHDGLLAAIAFSLTLAAFYLGATVLL